MKKILSTQRNRIYRLFKDSLKCCSCDYSYDTSALEFHHIVPANKLEDIPKLIAVGDYNLILEEFNKCAVLCSNCHNIIHNSMNIKNITNVSKSLTLVDTNYFKELCNMLNVLVDEVISEEIEEHNEILEEKLNKKKRQEKLLDILMEHEGELFSQLNKTKIAEQLCVSEKTINRDLYNLKQQNIFRNNEFIEFLTEEELPG